MPPASTPRSTPRSALAVPIASMPGVQVIGSASTTETVTGGGCMPAKKPAIIRSRNRLKPTMPPTTTTSKTMASSSRQSIGSPPHLSEPATRAPTAAQLWPPGGKVNPRWTALRKSESARFSASVFTPASHEAHSRGLGPVKPRSWGSHHGRQTLDRAELRHLSRDRPRRPAGGGAPDRRPGRGHRRGRLDPARAPRRDRRPALDRDRDPPAAAPARPRGDRPGAESSAPIDLARWLAARAAMGHDARP